MTDPIDAPEVEPEEINPWTEIWIHPQITIEWVVKNSPPWIPWALLFAAGVQRGVDRAMSGSSDVMGDMLLRAIFVSGIGGLILYAIVIGAIHFCSTWFGGSGTFAKTVIASGWSMVPALVLLIITLIAYLVFADSGFDEGIRKYAFWAFVAIQTILNLWTVVLWVATVAQVQEYSIGKAIASLLCATLLIIGPFIAFTILSGGRFSINF